MMPLFFRANYPLSHQDIRPVTGSTCTWKVPRVSREILRKGAPEIKQVCQLTEQGCQLLEQAMDKFGLSHRAYHRILKLARTIADLAGSKSIEMSHLSEAISYRKLDRTI